MTTTPVVVSDPVAAGVTQVAYDAGFRGTALVNAVALALSESGGNPAAINNNPATGDYSVGLWQINYYGALGPARTQQFGPPTNLVGTNPVGPEAHANAKAAYSLSGGGTTWSPWQADFNNGSYYRNLPRAQAAVTAFSPNDAVLGGTNGVPDQINTLSNITSPSGDHCLIHLGAATGPLNLIPGVSNLGPCLLSTSNVRAIGGVLLIGAGVLVGGLGVALLVGKSVDIGGLVGKVTPGGWVGALTAKSSSFSEKQVDSIERNAYEEGRREGATKGTVKDKQFRGRRVSMDEDF